MGDDLPFVDLGTGRTVTSVVAGHYATCAILDNGSVKCWGFGPQLGLGETPPWGDEPGEMGDNLPAVDLGAGRTAKQIGVGYWKACALLDDDSVKCWDQSPLPAVTVLGAPIAEISSGYAPYARFADGTVGEPESTERVALGRASPATALFSTDIGLCALLGDNSTVCQFKNEMAAVPPWGGPGIVAVSLSSFPGKHQCGLMLGGSVRCWVPPFYPETWVDPDVPADAQGGVTVKLAGPAVSVTSGGADYACALLNDGRVQCWGDQAAFLGNVDVNNGAHTIPLDLGTHWVP